MILMKPLNLTICAGAFALILFSCKKEEAPGKPVVTTLAVTEILSNSARGGGNVSGDAGENILSRGVVWGLTAGTTFDLKDGLTDDGSGVGVYISNLSDLSPNTTYYVRAYATNSNGIGYGNEVQFKTLAAKGSVTTAGISDLDINRATAGGTVADDGGVTITARGVCWSTSPGPINSNNYTTDGSGPGTFTSNITGLSASTTYYLRAYATNSEGTAYGEQISFTTPSGDVINPATGKTWMDRNLGATQVATSSTDANSYGHLYQWGRGNDGHQIRTSGTTTTLSSSNTPGHGNFIIVGSSPSDWRSPRNDNLWQGVSGINNPCPSGYRLPTYAELNAEFLSWSTDNASGALASPLKLPLGGYRYTTDGSLRNVGMVACYWTSTVSNTDSRNLFFYGTGAFMNIGARGLGYSVRCIKN